MDIPLKRSRRARRPVISDDYIVYLQEHEYDVGDVLDPTTYKVQLTIWVEPDGPAHFSPPFWRVGI